MQSLRLPCFCHGRPLNGKAHTQLWFIVQMANRWLRRSWSSLQQGVSTVLNSMQPWWKDESDLARFMESQRAFRSARSSMTPTYASQFHDEDLMRLDRVITSLQNIQQRISHNQEHYQRVTDLLHYTHRLRADLPVDGPEKAFERLQPLRTWLFWLPPTMLKGTEGDLGALSILSQFYGVALALEPVFPEIGGSYLASMAALPIEDIRRILSHRKASHPFAPEVQLAASLMDLPCEIVAEYRSNLQWSPRSSYDAYSPGHHSPYPSLSSPHIPAPSPTTSVGYSNYTASPLHSPLTPAIVGSPYQVPSALMSSRRDSHMYSNSSTLHHDPIHDRTADYKPHDPALFNPAYLGNLIHAPPAATLGSNAEYQDPPGINIGGFVAPELWT